MERYNINKTYSFWIFMAVLCVACFLYILVSKQKSNYESEHLFSCDNSNFVKSISAIGLIFHHYSQIMPTFSVYGEVVRDISSAIGFIFSAIFLFTSGYGLEKKVHITEMDIKNRIVRLIVPYFTMGLIVCLLINCDEGIINFIKKILTFFIVKNNGMVDGKWFIVAILYFNLTFMFTKRKFNNSKITIILNVLFLFIWIGIGRTINMGQWWYNTSACFLSGVLIARYERYWKRCIVQKPYIYWLSFVMFGIVFIFSTYWGGVRRIGLQ